ncbi:MAG: GntR family transcriptional regulator [Filifactoraceae bacterium]
MMKFNNDAPIYSQIVELVESRIISGEYSSGSRFPSVRELAFEVGVNPNTMQKAMVELERRKLIETVRNSGRLVTEDKLMICQIKKDKAVQIIVDMVDKLIAMGYQSEEVIEMVGNELKILENNMKEKS